MLNHLGRLAIAAAFSMHCAIAHSETVLHLNELAADAGAEAAALGDFKKEIETATHGAVRIDLHFAGALGNPSTSLENMMSGDLDLFSGELAFYLPLIVDEISGLDMPFMVPSNAAAKRYIASPLFEAGRAKDLQLRHIRFLELDAFHGPYRMVASARPIASLDDLKGLKLAVFPAVSKIGADVWKALGVSIVEIDWKDVAGAFEQHRIDAVIAPDLADLLSADITRFAPYIGAAQDHPQIWQITINESAWQKLAPPQQSIVAKAAVDAAATYNRVTEEQFKKQSSSLRGTTFGKGIKIDTAAAHERLLPVYDRLITEGGTTEAVRDTANQAMARP